MNIIKLLIVDDQQLIRDGIKSMFKEHKEINVIAEASSFAEALFILKNNYENIDVILMDIKMPGIDGVEGTQIITDKFKGIKILALTSFVEEQYAKSMIKAGALGYVSKNSSIDELTKAIKAVSQGEKYYTNDVSVALVDSLINQENLSENVLSKREMEVLQHLVDGDTCKNVGEKLFLSCRTVESHKRNILSKLELKNTAEMIKYAYQNKLVK